jgi:hypothetical protein
MQTLLRDYTTSMFSTPLGFTSAMLLVQSEHVRKKIHCRRKGITLLKHAEQITEQGRQALA